MRAPRPLPAQSTLSRTSTIGPPAGTCDLRASRPLRAQSELSETTPVGTASATRPAPATRGGANPSKHQRSNPPHPRAEPSAEGSWPFQGACSNAHKRPPRTRVERETTAQSADCSAHATCVTPACRWRARPRSALLIAVRGKEPWASQGVFHTDCCNEARWERPPCSSGWQRRSRALPPQDHRRAKSCGLRAADPRGGGGRRQESERRSTRGLRPTRSPVTLFSRSARQAHASKSGLDGPGGSSKAGVVRPPSVH